MLTLFKRLVEFHLADGRAQRGLRQLGDGGDVVAGAIGRQAWIGHLEIQHAVHLQLSVVLGDANLARHIQRHFLQQVAIGDAVDERHHDIQARRQRGMEFTQTLDHPGVLLRHDLDSLDHEHDDDEQNEQCDFHGRNSPG